MNNYPTYLAETPFYSVWCDLPELHETADPFDFKQRMAMLKLLIDSTNKQGIFGEDNALNIFWAYMFQLHWQWRSGRYTLADTPPDRIDPNSMWGYGNYSLIVIPLVAAIQVGLAPELEILPPQVPSEVDYVSGGGRAGNLIVPPAFAYAVEEWRGLFQMIQRASRDSDLEPIRFKLWEVHGLSLAATSKGDELLAHRYSRKECDFMRGWVRLVEFLEVAAWRTDIEYMMNNGLDVLPERMLTEEDIPGLLPDQNTEANSNVKSIFELVALPQWRYNMNLYFWKRAMRKREARDQVLAMLDATFHPSPKNVKERRRLLGYMLAF